MNIMIRLESTFVNGQEFVTRGELEQAVQAAVSRAAEMAQCRMKNNSRAPSPFGANICPNYDVINQLLESVIYDLGPDE